MSPRCLVLLLFACVTLINAYTLDSAISNRVAPFYFVGREAFGLVWEYRLDKGFTVRRLQIWWTTSGNDAVLCGMKVLFTDGTWSLTRGWETGKTADLKLQDGELITQVIMWGDKNSPSAHTRLARVEITTSNGQTLFAGRDQPGLVAGSGPYTPDVGSGVLVGFGGAFGAQVDGAGFLFYKPIKSINLYDVNYWNAPSDGDAWGMSPIAIDEVVFRPSRDGANWRFAGSIQRSESHSWSSQTTESYGVSLTVSAKFLFIKFEAKAEWKRETVTQSSAEVTTDVALTWDMSGTAQPNSSGIIPPFKCVAKVYTANLDLNWNGLLRITFLDGVGTIDTAVKGTYSNLVYSRVDSGCAPL